MTKDQAFLFLDEYQALCEKYQLQISLFLDETVVEDCPGEWIREDVDDLRTRVAEETEDA